MTAVRSATGTSIGDGGDLNLLLRIRHHGNCSEWSGFVLILMILAEGMGTPDMWLHISGALLLIGRVAHPFGLKATVIAHPLRYVGNGTNFLAALNSMACIVIHFISL